MDEELALEGFVEFLASVVFLWIYKCLGTELFDSFEPQFASALREY